MGAGSWVLPAAGGIVLSVVVMSVLGLLCAALALAVPARRQGSTPLRVALAVSPPEVSRRAALAAWMRWLKAYMSTSRGLRLARILGAAMAAPTGLASARWRRRAVLLTSRGGCLRVLEQPGVLTCGGGVRTTRARARASAALASVWLTARPGRGGRR